MERKLKTALKNLDEEPCSEKEFKEKNKLSDEEIRELFDNDLIYKVEDVGMVATTLEARKYCC